jgi:hypothetical protein
VVVEVGYLLNREAGLEVEGLLGRRVAPVRQLHLFGLPGARSTRAA